METTPGEVTLLLLEVKHGLEGAEERLVALVYKELRALAAGYIRKEFVEHTLQPTALVHEAYLRLTRMEPVEWQSRSHFFAVAAKVMRNILVDHARARQANKRGQDWKIVGLDEAFVASPGRANEIIALDDALDRLAVLDSRQSRIVELRFFSGLNEEETGHVLGVSSRTVKRDWRLARAWLYRELSSKALSEARPNNHGVRSTP